jgi:hypothetical protein
VPPSWQENHNLFFLCLIDFELETAFITTDANNEMVPINEAEDLFSNGSIE